MSTSPATSPHVSAAKSVLVTGASGLIGHQVIAQLVEEPGTLSTIVALDLRLLPESERLDGVSYETGDIRKPDLEALFRHHEVDTVVHLAAVVSAGNEDTREHDYSVDVAGTENVLACALGAGVSHLVYTSSGAAYGYHADNPVPLSEDDALRGNPEFVYADHKRLVEEMLARHRDDHPELAQLIFRPGTILGETVDNQITGIFSRPVIVGVSGSDSPFVLIWDTDVAAAIVKGVSGRETGIYNLAGDGSVTLPDIAKRLGKRYVAIPVPIMRGILGLLKTLRVGHASPGQVKFLSYRPVLSNDRLKSEFGFAPSLTSSECFDRYQSIRFGE